MAYATFDFEPDKIWDLGIEFDTRIVTSQSGREQRSPRSAKRRLYMLEFAREMSTFEAILDFFEAREGMYEAFYWQDPREEEGADPVLVRFDMDRLDATNWDDQGGVLEVVLKEVIGEDEE